MNQRITDTMSQWPMLIGLFGVILFAAGFFAPLSASADVLGPCCTVPGTTTPPPTTTVVTTPPPVVPSCSISASAVSSAGGTTSSTLSWHTAAASSAVIDNGVGNVTPVSNGTKTVTFSKTTKYTMTVTAGGGGQATCSTTVSPPPPPAKPTCTLSANPNTIKKGGSSTLSWKTTGATAFSIDNSIGSQTSVDSGSTSTGVLTKTTTYTGTAEGPGGSVTCNTTVTVTTTPPPAKPTCTLSANPNTVGSGDTSVLSWTTAHATSFSIDQGIGAVTPLASGSTTTSALTKNTTFTGTVTGPGGTATCNTTVTVTTTPPPSAPSCTLSASPASLSSGGTAKLTWSTTNATSFTIDNSIGAVTPVGAGSTTTPSLSSSTTYTGTAEGPNGSATCKTTVTVTPPPSGGGLSCTLSASPTSVAVGGTTDLSWTTTGAVSFSINDGIGDVTPVATGATTSPSISSNTTFTGTATDATGNTVVCTASVTIPTPPSPPSGGGGGGCTGSTCGGGGGGTPPPTVTLSELPHVGNQPLAYLYLSQIPYTGLNLGPVGTAVYWTVFGLISLILAYFVLFGLVPFANNARRDLFGRLWTVLMPQAAAPTPVAGEEAVIITETPSPVAQPAAPQPFVAATAPEAARGYSSFDGFKSFAHGDTLSIDDIVSGLSREPVTQRAAAPTPAPEPEPAAPVTPAAQRQPVYPTPTPAPESVSAPADVRGIVMALLDRDRAAVFAGLRQHVRGGGSPETLISSIAFVIDDVYRARVDGTRCDAEIAAQTAPLPTVVLEKLVGSLATAIDSSYTDSITGAKMALTRALDAIGA